MIKQEHELVVPVIVIGHRVGVELRPREWLRHNRLHDYGQAQADQ
nr:hypothetical protein [Kibdelosporangium sp. MJ126-NF4]CTQ90876.1 hypothetical protein [Kibdelosporangium sp. MJ126-NF4]